MIYEKTKIIETPFSLIYYYPDLQVAEISWLDNILMDSNSYRSSFLQIFEFAKNNKVQHLLSDVRKQSVVSPNEKKWFKNQMFPIATKAGLKNVAIITNDNVFKIYYLNAITKIGSSFEIKIKTFNDHKKAFDWLQKITNNN